MEDKLTENQRGLLWATKDLEYSRNLDYREMQIKELADPLLMLGDAQSYKEIVNRLIALNERDCASFSGDSKAMTQITLARHYNKIGEWDKSLAAISTIDKPEYLEERAIYAFRAGHYDKALKGLSKAYRETKDESVLVKRAFVLLHMGEVDKSIVTLTLVREPSSLLSYLYAYISWHNEDTVSTLNHLREITPQDNYYWEAQVLHGDMFRLQGSTLAKERYHHALECARDFRVGYMYNPEEMLELVAIEHGLQAVGAEVTRDYETRGRDIGLVNDQRIEAMRRVHRL